jgi:ferric-dicitrate binding protein FerR (iron transport regulator)
MTSQADRLELYAKYASGDATRDEIQRLNEAILQDAALRREFVEFMHLDASLEDWAAGAVEVRSPKLAARYPMRVFVYAATAAAIVLIGLLTVRNWRSDDNRASPQVASAPTMTQATLVLADECRWGGNQHQEGRRLAAGPIRLLSGNAVIRLDGGTLLMLRGDCELELRSDGGINLRRGVVAARSADEVEGFVVYAPKAKVVDLGTEFVLRVDDHGNTEVHVVEGSVRVDDVQPAAQESPILLAENAVRIKQDDSLKLEPIPYSGEPISEAVKRLRQDRSTRLIAEEAFAYPAGTHQPHLLDGGTGWNGPWRLPVERDGSPAYPGTQRLMAIEVVPDFGGVWRSPSGKSFRTRWLAEPVELKSDDVIYVGLTIHADEPAADAEAFAEQARSVRLSFRTPATSPPESISFGFNKVLKPIIETAAGRSFVGRTKLPDVRRVRLIGKLLSRAEGEDELSLIFLDESDLGERIEPEVWDVASRGVQLNGSLREITIASHGPAPRRLDDLRIGPTWWSVVRKEASP